jgi:hypothetical protein
MGDEFQGYGDILKLGGSVLTAVAGSQSDINNAKMQYEFAKNGLSWKIRDAAKHGIHPLAAIGASPTPMPTVPMSGSLSGLSSALTTIGNMDNSGKIVEKQIQKYVLAQLQREALNAKWDYSLLIPVDHPQYPGLKFWGFNSKYNTYGTFPNMAVMAANAEQALELMKEEMTPKQKAEAKKAIEDAKKKWEGSNKKAHPPMLWQPFGKGKKKPPTLDTDINP